jgi:iron complex transport system ATP-binding protein
MTRKNHFALRLSKVTLVSENRVILHNLSWQVKEGEHWAVVGANGAGKTMMLRVASGYLWPTKGTVSILGKTFGTIDLRELRKKIGWISSALRDMIPRRDSVLDVVLSGQYASLGLWDKPIPSEINLAHQIIQFMGCEDLVTHSFGRISQGEQQKIIIARALMAQPRLLILDEPCAGLDLLARETLLDTISSLVQQKHCPTVIFVTHHIEEIIPIFSHVLILKSGRILAKGLKEEILTSNILSHTFGVNVKVVMNNGRFWSQILPNIS